MHFKILKFGRKTTKTNDAINKNPSAMADFGPTARMPTKKDKRAWRQTVRIDMTQDVAQSIANPDNDHSKDEKMGCFNYWHYRITGWVPDNMGGEDGKRWTNGWTQHYARRMHFYERRKSEKKAAKMVKKVLKEEQKHPRQSSPAPDIDPEEPPRKRKVSEMLTKKTYSTTLADQSASKEREARGDFPSVPTHAPRTTMTQHRELQAELLKE